MTASVIENGVVVAIAYRLEVDGQIVEEVGDDDPLEYLHGAENIVPGLEAALVGKQPGDSFDVTVEPALGYGDYDEELLETIAREEFDDIEDLQPGMEIELMDEEGDLLEALVREVTDEAVVLDFNSPLAGKTLKYHVKVVDLREPTAEEQEQGFPNSLFDDLYPYQDDEDALYN